MLGWKVAEGENLMSELDVESGRVPQTRKKPYEKPAMEILGSLSDLTQNKGTMSPNGDGAAKSPNKTG